MQPPNHPTTEQPNHPLSISVSWNTTPAERASVYPCDGLIPDADVELFRALTVHAPPEKIFPWVCQMRVAPYSYDWVDNLGRPSPRRLIPGLTNLECGQRVMHIFKLISFEPNRHITIRTTPKTFGAFLFGDFIITYIILPQANGDSRVLGKVVAKYPRGLIGWILRIALPWGDLVMMRKQLLNFKALAETCNELGLRA